MNKISKNYIPSFSAEDLIFINKIRIPALKDPVNMRIYWFQVHSHESSFYFTSHKHTFHEAHFIINGSMAYDVDGKRNVFEQGQFIMIPANTVHTQLSCSDDLVKLSLSFEIKAKQDDLLSSVMAKDLDRSSFICDNLTSEMVLAIELICAQAKRNLSLAPFTVRNGIFTLISEIYYATTQRQRILSTRSDEGVTDTRYIAAKKFIEDNIFIKLRSEDVAAHVHISAKQLNRIFLKYGDVTVFDYISNKKHIAAKELLLSTDLSLQDISEKLGFADEFYFNKCFAKKAGITPMKFRKINGKLIIDKEKGGQQNEVLQ